MAQFETYNKIHWEAIVCCIQAAALKLMIDKDIIFAQTNRNHPEGFWTITKTVAGPRRKYERPTGKSKQLCGALAYGFLF